MITDPIRRNDPRLIERLEEIRQEVLRLGKISGGQGISVRSGPGGIALSFQRGEGISKRGAASDEVSGTPKSLSQTQGSQDTDSYDRETDEVPVSLQVITDIKYDLTAHTLTFRTRTITATGITTVSAESDLVTITTAVECPCVV